MKIVYMGTPEIAKVCLEKLYTEGFDIAAVTCINTVRQEFKSLKYFILERYKKSRQIVKLIT